MKNFQITTINFNKSSDSWGAIASALCLAHCVLTPFLFIAQAHTHVEGHHESGPVWWGFIDYLFLAISFFAIRHSAKHTNLAWMPAALYTSWALLALYIVCEKYHLLHLSHELVYIPALSLVFLHLYNQRNNRLKKEDECCETEPEM